MKRMLLAAVAALASTSLSHPAFAYQTRAAPAFRAPAMVFRAQPRMTQQRFYVRQRPVVRIMRASRVRAEKSAPAMHPATRPGSAARAALVGGPVVGAGFVGATVGVGAVVAGAPVVGAASADTLEERNASWAKAWEIVSRNGGKVTKDCDEHCSVFNTGFDNRSHAVFMQIDHFNDGTNLREYCRVSDDGEQRYCTNWDTSLKRVFYWIPEEEAWRLQSNGPAHLQQQEAEELRPQANMPTYAPTVETASFPIEFDCNADNAGDPAFKMEISVPVANGSGRKPIAIQYGSISLTGTVNFAVDGSVASINAFGSADGQARELTLTPNLHDDQRVFLSGKLQPPGDSLMGRHCEATYYIADLRGNERTVQTSAPGGKIVAANSFGSTTTPFKEGAWQTDAKGAIGPNKCVLKNGFFDVDSGGNETMYLDNFNKILEPSPADYIRISEFVYEKKFNEFSVIFTKIINNNTVTTTKINIDYERIYARYRDIPTVPPEPYINNLNKTLGVRYYFCGIYK
ncbi:hypothetical protein [uncultured Rhodoblastus sp.]|uniref:hypothetical protein n=1 Tax=uncultured Rhodoblastus sp. TaxID=543037 RepID=UPI0025E932AF|nr:hypothetical protein [uncultured Rhodoblastus sp.]